jgi:curved DNA-binding protein CbpA
VFHVSPDDHLNADAINTRFNALAKKLHPDKPGGSHDEMAELNAARAAALAEVGF